MNPQEVFNNNKAWVASKLSADGDYFNNLAKGQSPDFLYIGCADSRVTAEAIMGAGPGDVFVHRNVANLVVNTDVNIMSVINYAVMHLKVSHVVVCGHYYCGGVKAAMGDGDLGILNPWLRNIRDVYRTHQAELDGIADEETRYRRLVELNVQEQVMNILKIEDVQKARAERNMQVHGWVFDIGTGELVDLGIDPNAIYGSVSDVYRVS